MNRGDICVNGKFADPEAPEGREVLKFNVLNLWGGGGCFVLDDFGEPIPLNLSAHATGELRFWLNSDTGLFVECEYLSKIDPDIRPFPKARIQVPSTGGKWKAMIFSLSDFVPIPPVQEEVNWEGIRSPFMVTAPAPTPDEKTFMVDHVRLSPIIDVLKVDPSEVEMPKASSRQFVVHGVDAKGDFGEVYANWQIESGDAKIESVRMPSRSVIVSANEDFTLSAEVTSGGKNLTTQVLGIVNDGAERCEFGLLCETCDEGVILDTDATLLAFPPPPNNNFPTLVDHADVKEGDVSLKCTFPVLTRRKPFSGWAIEWMSSDPEITRDMSKYLNGAIKFWFKAPAELNDYTQYALEVIEVSKVDRIKSQGMELGAVPLARSHLVLKGVRRCGF